MSDAANVATLAAAKTAAEHERDIAKAKFDELGFEIALQGLNASTGASVAKAQAQASADALTADSNAFRPPIPISNRPSF